jgi:hypothetical protein
LSTCGWEVGATKAVELSTCGVGLCRPALVTVAGIEGVQEAVIRRDRITKGRESFFDTIILSFLGK